MCHSTESGTGSTNQRFCLEQGILFAIPTMEHGRGDYFAARIAVQTNVVAVPARVPLHVHSNTPFPIRRSTVSHVFQSGTGQQNCVFLVWNRVRFSAAHPYPKLRGVPPPPPGFKATLMTTLGEATKERERKKRRKHGKQNRIKQNKEIWGEEDWLFNIAFIALWIGQSCCFGCGFGACEKSRSTVHVHVDHFRYYKVNSRALSHAAIQTRAAPEVSDALERYFKWELLRRRDSEGPCLVE